MNLSTESPRSKMPTSPPRVLGSGSEAGKEPRRFCNWHVESCTFQVKPRGSSTQRPGSTPYSQAAFLGSARGVQLLRPVTFTVSSTKWISAPICNQIGPALGMDLVGQIFWTSTIGSETAKHGGQTGWGGIPRRCMTAMLTG